MNQDDEEFKKLLNDYNIVKDALNDLMNENNEEVEDSDKTDLQHFFEAHNLRLKFPLAPMGVLATHLRTLDGPLVPPSTRAETRVWGGIVKTFFR